MTTDSPRLTQEKSVNSEVTVKYFLKAKMSQNYNDSTVQSQTRNHVPLLNYSNKLISSLTWAII